MIENPGSQIESDHQPLQAKVEANLNIAYFGVWGMGSQACALQVRSDLLDLDGVMQAEVSFDGRCAVAAFDSRRLLVDQLIQAIEADGLLGARRCWAELFLQLPYQAALERAGRAKPGSGIISLN